MQTPWGNSEDEFAYAPNHLVVYYTTESHGGFKVQPVLNAMIPAIVRNDNGWYEEDCEWAIVCYTFPSLFANRGDLGSNLDQIRATAHEVITKWWPDKAQFLDVSGPRTI